MRHVQVQRASARDEPINLRRESTLSIVSHSFVRSFVAFVRSSRAHRGRARVDVSVMIPPRRDRSIDRSIVSRARLTIGRRDRDRRRDDTYFSSSIHPFLARVPPLARVARARSNAPARDSASRRDDDRTRPPSLVAPDSAWRASFERVKKKHRDFSRDRRSLFHGASRVVEWRSIGRIGRIESNRIATRCRFIPCGPDS